MPYFIFEREEGSEVASGGRSGNLPSAEGVRVYGPRFISPLKDNGSSAGKPPWATIQIEREVPRPSRTDDDSGALTLAQVAADSRAWTNQRGQERAFSKLTVHYDQLDANNECEDLQVHTMTRVIVTEWCLDWRADTPNGVQERLVAKAYEIEKRPVDGDPVTIKLDPLNR